MTPDMEESPDIELPIHDIRAVKAIDFDPVNKQLYWIDSRAKAVKRVNETGIEVRIHDLPSWKLGELVVIGTHTYSHTNMDHSWVYKWGL